MYLLSSYVHHLDGALGTGRQGENQQQTQPTYGIWSESHPGEGGDTPYNGLCREALPERGTFSRLQVYKRVQISQVEVYKRVGKSVI